MEDYPDEEEMDDVNLDDERERHWRIVFEENDGGVDNTKALIHDKRWDIYVDEKEKLVKGGYFVEVVGHEKKKIIWEVVDNHVVEEPTDHEEIGLRGFDLNYFDQDEEGVGRRGSRDFPYLLILIKIWPENWMTLLKRINWNMYETSRKASNKGNAQYQKVSWFSGNELKKKSKKNYKTF